MAVKTLMTSPAERSPEALRVLGMRAEHFAVVTVSQICYNCASYPAQLQVSPHFDEGDLDNPPTDGPIVVVLAMYVSTGVDLNASDLITMCVKAEPLVAVITVRAWGYRPPAAGEPGATNFER